MDDGWMNGWMDTWTHGHMDSGQMDRGRKVERLVDSYIDPQIYRDIEIQMNRDQN